MDLSVILLLILVVASLIIIVILYIQKTIGTSLKYVDDGFKKDLQDKIDIVTNRIFQSKDENNRGISSLLDPIVKNMEHLQQKIDEIEKHRISRDSNLVNHLSNLSKQYTDLVTVSHDLRKETSKMINIFRKPNSRGKWGEAQLARIIEITGMIPHCDFTTQSDVNGWRPDLIIKLPKGGHIFVDSKAPLDAFIQSLDSSDEREIDKFRKENARSVRNHIGLLSNKKYWEQLSSPELVIMFIPMEHIWLSALEEDKNLLEYAVSKNVIVATPMTLVGLLKTIFYGWSHLHISQEIDKIKKNISNVKEFLLNMESASDKGLRHLKTLEACLKAVKNEIASIKDRFVLLTEDNMVEIHGDSSDQFTDHPTLNQSID